MRGLLVAMGLACGGALFFSGCGDSSEGPSASDDDAGGGGLGGSEGGVQKVCATNKDCDDGVFCNGRELCQPDDDDADGFGCIEPEKDACGNNSCNEKDESCGCEDPDNDGDGHDSVDCGGDDCDDNDANRYPGNDEVCDADNHDEDCDSKTFGIRDEDGDDDPDDRCCNEDEDSGKKFCGTDCDDSRAVKHSFNTETCDDIDNDCDGVVDELPDSDEPDGLKTLFTIDEDGDDFGSSEDGAATILACTRPQGYAELATDCDDAVAEISPAAYDGCEQEMIDQDCSGVPNDPDGGCSCTGTESRSCGAPSPGPGLLGLCGTFQQHCVGGVWGDCPIVRNSQAEVCDGEGVDEDCDGHVDESPGESTDFGLRIMCYPDLDEDNYAPNSTGQPLCACGAKQTENAPTGANSTDCLDDPAVDANAENINPGAADVCNGVDDDCSGTIDDDPSRQNTYFADMDGDDLGDPDNTKLACSLPTGHVTTGTDCNDNNASIRSVANCGTNGGAQYSCNISNGSCTVSGCNASGTDDCNDDFLDGCETNTMTSLTHCGGCTNGKGIGSAGESCHLVCDGTSCDDIVEVVAGDRHACGRRESGLVVCWGANDFGQMGDGTVSPRTSPVEVDGLSGVASLSAGANHTCAVRSNGSIYCWGDNRYGQTGRSATASPQTSAEAVTIANATHVAAGGDATCAISNGGALSCWGNNSLGQLGNGTKTANHLPQQVRDPDSVSFAQVLDADGVAAGNLFACAVRTGGSLICWGFNGSAQLGDGVANHGDPGCVLQDCSPVPVLASLSSVESVAIGATSSHACAISGGDAYCWGNNASRQVENSSTTPISSPKLILSDIAQLSTGAIHSCAVADDEDSYCWGSNADGRLGRGASGSGPFGPDNVSLSDADHITSGGKFSCAVRTSGPTVCWGNDQEGQLGNGGSATNENTPVAVGTL